MYVLFGLVASPPSSPCPGSAGHSVPGAAVGPVPVVRMFGVTEEGHSVACSIHGFTPYLFAILPRGADASNPAFEGTLRNTLNRLLAGRGRGVEEKRCANPVLGVKVHADKASLMGYQFAAEQRTFIQVFVAMPTMVPTLKRCLEEDGVEFPQGTLLHGASAATCPTFESNVPFILRYMIDADISGSNWLELPAGAYVRRAPGAAVTHCQLEVGTGREADE